MTPQLRRFALDLGPLFVFFIAYRFLGIYSATAVFMVAVLVALALDYVFDHDRCSGDDLRRTDALSEE